MAKKGKGKGQAVKGPEDLVFVTVRMDDESLHRPSDESIGYNTLAEAKREASSLAEEAGCSVVVYKYVGMYIPPEEVPPQWTDE